MKPVALLIPAATVLLAQAPDLAQKPEFEVAAIRPAKEDNEHSTNTTRSALIVHNVTLKRLIARAYDIDTRMISGGPKWVDSDGFDINAKIPKEFAEKDRDKIATMLQNLLADRFRLVIHRNPVQIAGYELMVAKSGPKMQPDESNEGGMKLHTNNTHLTAANVTMEAFAKDLSRNQDIGKYVVDKTGLSGRFKFQLDWMPERSTSSSDSSVDDRPSIFTALPAQLGLRLESAKISVSSIVIDRAEKPDGN